MQRKTYNMAWNFLKKKDVTRTLRESSTLTKVGTFEVPDKLTDLNAFRLASSVSEIYYPIDFIADRISKLTFKVMKGETEVKGDLARFVTNINPLYSFSDMVYMYMFSLLADGNTRVYRSVPDLYKTTNVNNISRINIFLPDELEMLEYSNVSKLSISKVSDVIRRAYVSNSGLSNMGFSRDELNVENLIINSIDASRRDDSMLLSKSPLFKAYRNINNLLAVYSARYNVYVNNGAAGILVRKGSTGNTIDSLSDVRTAEEIQAELNSRYGVTGNRNLWGISSTPLEFVKTLADIKDLMPLEETLENAIKIGGVYQIKPELLPRIDNAKFDNQNIAERSVWENTLMSLTQTFETNWARICMLDTVGCTIKADYSSVSCLKANETEKETNIKARLENLEKLRTMRPDKESEINKQIDLILEEYGQG